MTDTLAFDRSERWKDQDGHLHVRVTNISKATVNPYRGSEIPGWQALGLDGNRVYRMLRDPDELARAAETFNNLRLMARHVAVSAENPQEELVAGSTGTDARFEDPYLVNSLVIWRGDDIADVESRDKCELSCGYYYDPDMTPGNWRGMQYDGVMRNLRGNHVALVEAGRAGPDVQVHDSVEKSSMPVALKSRAALVAKGALLAHIRPRLTAGSVLAMDSVLAGVTAKTWKTSRPRVTADIVKLVTPMLAKDQTLADLPAVLLALDGDMEEDEKMDDEDEDDKKADDEDAEAEKKEAVDKKARDAKAARDKKARDEFPDKKDDDDDDEDDKAKDQAMDAAIRKAVSEAETRVMARMRDLAEARDIVRPIIGNVSMAIDSAAAVYKLALDSAKVDLRDVPPAAYRAMVGMLPKPGTARPASNLAMDSRTGGLEKRFPAVSRFNQA